MKKKRLIYFCSALLALQSAAAMATCPPTCSNDGVEIEPLFFGQVIITSNAAVYSCVLPAGGTMTCDPQIIILNPGQYGVFRLSGFDPTVAISATILDTTLYAGDGTTFDVTNFTFAPNINSIGGIAEAPPGGTLTLEIGATLKTRALTTYDIAPYHGTYTLQIDF